MTELSALAGSEGYAACDDEAQCRIVRLWRTTEARSAVPVSIGRSRPGDFIVKKGRRVSCQVKCNRILKKISRGERQSRHLRGRRFNRATR